MGSMQKLINLAIFADKAEQVLPKMDIRYPNSESNPSIILVACPKYALPNKFKWLRI
jgi:hypothetical protein